MTQHPPGANAGVGGATPPGQATPSGASAPPYSNSSGSYSGPPFPAGQASYPPYGQPPPDPAAFANYGQGAPPYPGYGAPPPAAYGGPAGFAPPPPQGFGGPPQQPHWQQQPPPQYYAAPPAYGAPPPGYPYAPPPQGFGAPAYDPSTGPAPGMPQQYGAPPPGPHYQYPPPHQGGQMSPGAMYGQQQPQHSSPMGMGVGPTPQGNVDVEATAHSAFTQADTAHKEHIDVRGFIVALRAFGVVLEYKDMLKFFETADRDESGHITRAEFVHLCKTQLAFRRQQPAPHLQQMHQMPPGAVPPQHPMAAQQHK